MNEPDSFAVKPIPATAGAGNPVHIPAGEQVPPPEQVTSNSVYSTVTTSQDDYEKAGSTLPIIGGAVAAAGAGVGLGALSSEKKENLIPESSLPMTSTAGSELDAGPTISSVAPTSTTADLAGQVPLEERKEATVDDPRATTSTVPEVVKESIAEAHTDPEATTSTEAVKEKAAVEKALMEEVPIKEETGEPAPTLAAATSETAPSATNGTSNDAVPGTSSVAAAAVADGADSATDPGEVVKTTAPVEKTEGDATEYVPPQTHTGAPGVSQSAAAAISDGTEDPTLADEPAVRMMNQNEAEATGATSAPTTEAAPAATSSSEPAAAPAATPAKIEAPKAAAPESKKETAATPSSATSTPTKKPATTTPTSSPASASKDKKKKNRISSLFKKIFD
jgi:hypothetical protein